MKYHRWKELRKDYSRRFITYNLIKYYLRDLFWRVKGIIYFFIKFKHKHIWNNGYCVICRKSKVDIDRERIKKKGTWRK